MKDPKPQTFIDYARSIPLDGYSLRRIFFDLVRIHFSDPGNYGALRNEMEKYIYVPGKPAESRVDIRMGHSYEDAEENNYPLVTVDIGNIQYQRVAVGDAGGDTTGRFTMKAAAPLEVRHLGKSVDETWALASLSSAFFFGFSKFIRDRLNLMDFKPVVTTTPQLMTKPENPETIFQSVFTAEIHYDYGWTMEVEGHNAVLAMPQSTTQAP
jgi:hypothetical protein